MTVRVPESRLAGFYFFYFAEIGAFMPYWSLYLEKQGFSKLHIAYLASLTVITRIVAPSVWGCLADRSGQRMRWVRIGTIAQLVAWTAILYLPNTLAILAVIMLLFSFFQNAILAQFEAVTLFWLGDQRDRYGLIRLWGSIGFIAAVFGLGWWFSQTSVQQLPLIMLGFAAFTVANAYWIAEPPRSVSPLHTPKLPLRTVLRRHRVWLFFALEFLLLLSHAPFYSFYSNYLSAYGYSTTMIGALWGAGVLAEVLMFTQSQRVLARWSERSLFIVCLAATAVRWVLVATYPDQLAVQFVAQAVHALSFALFQSLAMRLIFIEFSADQQGRAQALYSMLWGLGVAIGSLWAGAYWDLVGGSAIFMVAAGVCVLAAWGCGVYWPKQSLAVVVQKDA